MATEIEKAAAQVAKLRAQADKVSGPLAVAEAQLQAAREAEAARRAGRAEEYNREFVETWRERADEAAHSGDAARDRFVEALSAEPWFAAYVEYRAARYKRGHVMTEAEQSQRALGEEVTVPQQRWYDAQILEEILNQVEVQAAEFGAEFAEELRTTRKSYVSGTD